LRRAGRCCGFRKRSFYVSCQRDNRTPLSAQSLTVLAAALFCRLGRSSLLLLTPLSRSGPAYCSVRCAGHIQFAATIQEEIANYLHATDEHRGLEDYAGCWLTALTFALTRLMGSGTIDHRNLDVEDWVAIGPDNATSKMPVKNVYSLGGAILILQICSQLHEVA
jgi:hypothetical protein